jgi:membrane protein implicated in regulation of membrane protease activity
MHESTWWWVLAGALVALELATGTFYLLMLALGAASGAVAAHLGLDTSLQIAAAAIVGGLATWVWHLRRSAQAAQAAGDPIGHMDVGQTVQVTQWQSDGTTRVQHRGSPWRARLRTRPLPGTLPEPGPYRIADTNGTELILEKV